MADTLRFGLGFGFGPWACVNRIIGTKVELFSADKNEQELEDLRNSTQVNQAQAKDSNLIEEENKKLYTALL